MFEIEYNQKKYMVGDRIKFNYMGDEYVASLKFGEYEDAEGYSDYTHLGFYVEYDNSRMTLPDVVLRGGINLDRQ